MIGQIVQKELLEMRRDGRLRATLIVASILILGALIAGTLQVRGQNQARAEAADADREAWVGQGSNNPHSAAHYGMWAFKPVSPLAVLDVGVNPYTGVALFMEGHVVQDARYRPAEDEPPGARLGTLSVATVLQYLLPLLILLTTFGAFAGERERGTLRQVLSLGVRPTQLLAGKSIAAVVPIAGLLVIAAAFFLASLLFVGDASWSLPRFGLLILAYLIYLGGYVGVSMLVSLVTASRRSALTALLGFWVVTSFVVPRFAGALAEAVHPTPSYESINAARLADMETLPAWGDRTREIEADLMAEYGVEDPDDLPVAPAGYVLDWFEQQETVINRRHIQGVTTHYDRQERTMALTGALSPLVSMQLMSMSLAGTDLAHHNHFATEAEEYRARFVGELNGDLMVNQRPNERRMVGAEFWETIPEFVYQPPGTAWALQRQLLSLGLLVAWFLVATALPVVAAGRLKEV